MKRLSGLLLLSILGWLVLSGCAPTDNLARGGQIKETSVVPETTESPSLVARVPQLVGKDDSMYPPQDLSLVANTGRPQLLNSYADWCTTCKHNKPLVDALSQQFAGKVDLVSLNIDVPETQAARDEFNITDRSQYVFIDAKGNIIQRWYGFLDDANVAQTIQDYLAKQT